LDFTNFIDIHKNDKVIVAGCGNSLNIIKNLNINNLVHTFGVNDVPSLFQPTYMVVVDHPSKFKDNRNLLIENCTGTVFTQIQDWKIKSGRKVLFKLGSRGKLDNIDKPNDLIDYSNNSPYVACCIARKMGFTNIGLIGVDFTPDHFYAQDGNHSLVNANKLAEINTHYKLMYHIFKAKNINLYNLSPNSTIDIPKISIEDFLKINKLENK